MCTCPVLDQCPFFKNKLTNMPPNSEVHKINYCINDSFKCARLLAARILGTNSIPQNLLPNEMLKIEELINTQQTKKQPRR